jgi:hypothetical protein
MKSMRPLFKKKFGGLFYQHHLYCDKKNDALDEKKALIAEGHRARFMKDPVFGLYHVYVRFEESSDVAPEPDAFDPFPLPEPVPFQYNAGLDFLKVSLHLDWSDSRFMADLARMKLSFADEDDNVSELPFHIEGGLDFNLLRKGGGKYPYKLKSGDITLLFSNHKSDASFPNCRLEIGSISCWEPGCFSLYTRILSWLRVFGAQVRKEKVSEFHLTADILGCCFSSSGFDDLSRWVTRANDFGLLGKYRIPNYIRFGKGDFMLRIYDKTAELSPNSPKEIVFHGLWSKKLNGLPPEHVTRIEFQIRRKVSKELQIETVADLRKKLNAAWGYCTEKWCRFTEKSISEADRANKNHQRYETSSLWLHVRSVKFDSPETDKIIRRCSVPQHIDVASLVKIASGCLLTACAAHGFDSADLLGHIFFASDLIKDRMTEDFERENKKYQRKIRLKRNLSAICF